MTKEASKPAKCKHDRIPERCWECPDVEEASKPAGDEREAIAEQDAVALRQSVATNLERVADCCEQELSETYDAYWMREGAKLLRADLEIAAALAPKVEEAGKGEAVAVVRHVGVAFMDGRHAQAFLTPAGEQLPNGTHLYAHPSQQALSEVMDEVCRAMAVIAVVGNIDGYDVIRRGSVLEIAADRAMRAHQKAILAAAGGARE